MTTEESPKAPDSRKRKGLPLPEVSKKVIERSRETLEETQEKAREVLGDASEKAKEALENGRERIGDAGEKAKEAIAGTQERTKEAIRRSGERTRGAIQNSRVKTRAAMARSGKRTRKVFNEGKEDLKSGAVIIRREVGYGAFREDKRAYFIRVAKLAGPVVFLASWFMLLLWVPAIDKGIELAFSSFMYLLPSPFGKESMIPFAIASGASPWTTALSFTFVDLTLVTFVAFNFDYILMVPNLGRFTAKLVRNSQSFLASKPWVGQFAMVGLFFFVMLPFQGGGGSMGAIVGRVMGLRPWRIIIPVAMGSALESFALAFASDAFLSFIPSEVRYALVGVLLVAVVLYFFASRRHARKKEASGKSSS